MKELNEFILVLVTGFVALLAKSFTLAILWSWYFHAVNGLPQIKASVFFGLLLLVRLFFYSYKPVKDDEIPLIKAMSANLFICLMALFFGYICKVLIFIY